MQHLAVFSPGIIDKIIKGEKKVESRFSKFKFAPFGRVKEGDVVFMKESGGKVYGKFRVGKALFYDDLNPAKLGDIRKAYENDLAVPDDFWKRKQKVKYATLIFIESVEKFDKPITLDKHDKRSWVPLEKSGGYSSKAQLSIRFSDKDSISNLSELLKLLNKERKQKISDSPKELALSLMTELGDLVSSFGKDNDKIKRAEVEREIADLMMQLIQLSDKLNINLFTATKKRIEEVKSKISMDELRD